MIEKFIMMCEKFTHMEFKKKPSYALLAIVLGLMGVFWATPAYCNGQKGPVIVTEDGITITKCEVTPQSVTIEWNTTDERIVIGESIFKVQARKLKSVRDGMFYESYNPQWQDLIETTGTNIVHEGFTVGETWEYRIAVDITELIDPDAEVEEETTE